MDERKEYTYSKAELRGELSNRRKALADKSYLSRKACMNATAVVHGSVMVYVAIGSELDTTELIHSLMRRDDIVLYAPYTVGNEIFPRRLISLGKPNNLGNLPDNCYSDEPFDKREQTVLDCCVTPLLGFNGSGYRIGYGKGCYDRFFESNPCKKIGLAFECQKQEFLPDLHDVPLDCCVTEKNVVYF